MNIELLSGALGAEIEGLELKDSSPKNFKAINDLLLEHKVIFFRNQNIKTEEQIRADILKKTNRRAFIKIMVP